MHLRQRFKAPESLTVRKVRLMPMWFGPSGGTGNLKVELVEVKTTGSTIVASATYTPSEGYRCAASQADYQSNNPWSESTALPGTMKWIEKTLSAAVTLNPSYYYYLEFSQVNGGNATWVIPVHEDANEKGYYSGPNVTPESWALTNATRAMSRAEQSVNGGSSWALCSIWDANTSEANEVRARLVS
jgi:hypothetical protein